jgi:5-formyltetrahydrofolate cyclo-ligase
MNKSLLRAEMKEKLTKIINFSKRSEALSVYFEEYKTDKDIRNVAVYIAYDTECDVLPLVEKLWEEDINVYVFEYPKKQDDFALIPWYLTSNIVKMGGVRIPLESQKVELSDIDMIIVPGLAYTEQGDRLGRGAGFYDQVLEDFDGTSVGVCFKEQLLEELPCEEHDISVDLVWSV